METAILVLVSATTFFSMVGVAIVYLASSGIAGIIKSQQTLIDSMQVLSNQMADLEEKQAEMHSDVRKVTTHFVNLAKSLKSAKSWDSF